MLVAKITIWLARIYLIYVLIATDIKGIYVLGTWLLLNMLMNYVYDYEWYSSTAHVYSEKDYTDEVLRIEKVKDIQDVLITLSNYIKDGRVKNCPRYYIVYGNEYLVIKNEEYEID